MLPAGRRRAAAVAAATLILLTYACGAGEPEPANGPTAPPAEATAVARLPATAPRPGAATAPARSTGTSGTRGARTTSAPARPVDGGDPGANAAAYLQRRVPELVVEIDAVPGAAPRPESVDLLRRRLGEVVDKPGGITILPTGSASAGDGAWSFSELQGAEAAHRTTRNSTSGASLYLLFVDGRPPREGAIGVAYSASAAAIFSDQIDEAATLLVTAAEIERADVVHEVGHLLSLVNLGYTSSRDHEDADHPGHSDNPASVMYWAVDNVGVATLLGGRPAPPTEFDADDLADLAAIRSGKRP
jgi:hypothetical protein